MSDLFNPSLNLVYKEMARKQIKGHEGYKSIIYKDTQGVLTGGYGHAFHLGSSLPVYVWDTIFDYDFELAYDQTMDLVSQRNWHMIGHIRRNVILEMIYNLGVNGVLKFKKMLAAIDNQDYTLAAVEMLDSQWAEQVGQRAITLANQMRRGTI